MAGQWVKVKALFDFVAEGGGGLLVFYRHLLLS